MKKDGRRARKQQISSQAWDLRVSERGSLWKALGQWRAALALAKPAGLLGLMARDLGAQPTPKSTPKSTPVREKNPNWAGCPIWFAQESPAMELAQTHGEQIDGRMTRSKETDTAEDKYKWSRQGDV